MRTYWRRINFQFRSDQSSQHVRGRHGVDAKTTHCGPCSKSNSSTAAAGYNGAWPKNSRGLAASPVHAPDGVRQCRTTNYDRLKTAGSDAISSYNKFVRPGTQNAHVDTAFSPIQAAAGLAQFRTLDEMQKRRSQAAMKIIDSLPAHVTCQKTLSGDQHAWYFLVATSEQPDELVQSLRDMRVDVGRYPMRNVAALDDPANGPRQFPNAQWVYEHSIQIPIHPTLSDTDVQRVCSAFRRL